MRRKLFLKILLMAVFVTLAVSVCMPALPQTEIPTQQNGAPVSEADDAFHYKYSEGTAYSSAYTEWWYFNVYDRKKDLQAIFHTKL